MLTNMSGFCYSPSVFSTGLQLSTLVPLPCAQASTLFLESNTATSTSFYLALNTLHPVLADNSQPLSFRILSAYIIYTIYDSYPIIFNPFHDSFVCIRDDIRRPGEPLETQPLLWVLTMLLQDRGLDASS